jgi:polyphosphate kinase 2 (PPK2 family)
MDRLKQWKLSPVDLQSVNKWNDYSKSIARMFEYTDTPESPWLVVRSDDKKRARINCIMHVLNSLPYSNKNKKLVVPPDPRILGPAKTMYESFAEKQSRK